MGGYSCNRMEGFGLEIKNEWYHRGNLGVD